MQTTDNYPTGKVIVAYSLLGGIVGGLIVVLIMGSALLFEQLQHHNFKTDMTAFVDLLFGFAGILMVSFFVGLLPALFASLAITAKRIRLVNKFAYFQIALSGFLATLPVCSILIGFMVAWSNGSSDISLTDVFKNLLTVLEFCGIGALSSLIVGKFVLPKT